MPIPDVAKEKIVAALDKFDREYRNDKRWIGWEQQANQKYAIVYKRKLYPPKMIISIATGISRNNFTDGEQTNGYLRARGFTIINLE